MPPKLEHLNSNRFTRGQSNFGLTSLTQAILRSLMLPWKHKSERLADKFNVGYVRIWTLWWPIGESNPCRRRERAVS